MPSPFPGMDPYLEHPRFFPDLHGGLITFLKQELQQRLPEAYYAQADEQVWLETSHRYVEPDVNVMRERRSHKPRRRRRGQGGVAVAEPEAEMEQRFNRPVTIIVETVEHAEHAEPFLEIHGRWNGQDRLVAAIEVVSPFNKTPGNQGYDKYRTKQREILAGQAHLIEIDLLRAGTHVTVVPPDIAREEAGPFDYHVSIHRCDRPREYVVYPIRLGDRLPVIDVPLLAEDPSVLLDLQAAFDRAYDAGPYRKRIRYGEDAIDPPLEPEQVEWAKTLLKAGQASGR
jgi:Protein of unknown function (DUF4058)